jgi:Na+/pantothenate symporter
MLMMTEDAYASLGIFTYCFHHLASPKACPRVCFYTRRSFARGYVSASLIIGGKRAGWFAGLSLSMTNLLERMSVPQLLSRPFRVSDTKCGFFSGSGELTSLKMATTTVRRGYVSASLIIGGKRAGWFAGLSLSMTNLLERMTRPFSSDN